MKIITLLKKSLKIFRLSFLPMHITNNNIHFTDANDYMEYRMASGDDMNELKPSGGCNSGCITKIIIAIIIFGVLAAIGRS